MITNCKIPRILTIKYGRPIIIQPILTVSYMSGLVLGSWSINVSEVNRIPTITDLYK